MEKAGGTLRRRGTSDRDAKNPILGDLSEFLDYIQSWSLIRSEFRHTRRARQLTTQNPK